MAHPNPAPPLLEADEAYMRQALRLARAAWRGGDVPVGAVAVRDGTVIARASNRVEREGDATAHAELLLLRRCGRLLGDWRLTGVTVVVTLEPCPMCAGALIAARVDRCVYGARDGRKGADGSAYDVLRRWVGDHCVAVSEGVLAEECSSMLRAFFRDIRTR